MPALSLLVILSFVLATSFVLVQTTADGLFIHEFGAHQLPLAYLSIAAFASLFAYLYLWLSERVELPTALFANLGFLAAMCTVLWVGLRSSAAHWVIFCLPFWFNTLGKPGEPDCLAGGGPHLRRPPGETTVRIDRRAETGRPTCWAVSSSRRS